MFSTQILNIFWLCYSQFFFPWVACMLSSSGVVQFIKIQFFVGYKTFACSFVVHDVIKSQHQSSYSTNVLFCWDKHAANHGDADMPQTPLFIQLLHVPWEGPASSASEPFDLVLAWPAQ